MRFLRVVAAAVAVVIAVVLNGGIWAATATSSELAALEDKLAKATVQRKEAQTAIENAKNERSDAITAKTAIDTKILALNTELDALLGLIEGYEAQIAEKDAQIADKTEKLEAQYQIVRERIRMMREDGGVDMLSIIFESDGLTEFFTEIDRFSCMLDYDGRLLDSYNAGIAELNTLKDGLVDTKNQLDKQKSELEERRRELDEDLAAAEKLISDAESDIKVANANLTKIAAEEAKYNEEREKKIAELQKSSNQSYVGGTFLWPLPEPNTKVSCGFGPRIHPVTGQWQIHLGIDIPAPYGTEIYAVNDGTVIEVSHNYADGYYVTISHGGGVASFYSHLSKYTVKVGDKVKRGQIIAYVGTSGYVTGAHLNLNIYENSTAVDPMGYFN